MKRRKLTAAFFGPRAASVRTRTAFGAPSDVVNEHEDEARALEHENMVLPDVSDTLILDHTDGMQYGAGPDDESLNNEGGVDLIEQLAAEGDLEGLADAAAELSVHELRAYAPEVLAVIDQAADWAIEDARASVAEEMQPYHELMARIQDAGPYRPLADPNSEIGRDTRWIDNLVTFHEDPARAIVELGRRQVAIESLTPEARNAIVAELQAEIDQWDDSMHGGAEAQALKARITKALGRTAQLAQKHVHARRIERGKYKGRVGWLFQDEDGRYQDAPGLQYFGTAAVFVKPTREWIFDMTPDVRARLEADGWSVSAAPSTNRTAAPRKRITRDMKVPQHDFSKADYDNRKGLPVTTQTVRDDYGVDPEYRVYQDYLPLDQLKEQLAEGESGKYDWAKHDPAGVYPPIKVHYDETGEPYIHDGNHRVRYWKDQGFTHAPAWVIDERKKRGERTATAELDVETVRAWADEVKARLGLQVFSVYLQRDGSLKLDTLIVPKDARKQGLGTAAMDELNAFADEHGVRVVLSPAVKDDYHGTTSRSRLVKFYKDRGYTENKGRKKDFSISDGMYRDPKKRGSLLRVAAADFPPELDELVALAQQAPTFDEFRREVQQKHLVDLSSQLFRWGRAFSVWKGESKVTVADLANGENDNYLTTVRYEAPATYRAIIATGAQIAVYRAVPAEYAKQGIRVGDYVSLDKAYAQMHGQSVVSGQQKLKYRVISKTVPKTDVIWGEADWNEWAYSPQQLRAHVPTLEEFYAQVRGRSAARTAGALIEQAIDEMAKGDFGLRQQLEQAARSLMGEGYEEDEIADELWQRRQRHVVERAVKPKPSSQPPLPGTGAITPEDAQRGFPGAQLVGESEGYWTFHITTWAGAKRLGTTNWCIVRDEETWKNYTQENGIDFFFHVSKTEGPPAKYAVAVMTDDDGKKLSETYGPEDEIILENVSGVHDFHEGVENAPAVLAQQIDALIAREPRAFSTLAENPTAVNGGLDQLLDQKRLPTEKIKGMVDAIASYKSWGNSSSSEKSMIWEKLTNRVPNGEIVNTLMENLAPGSWGPSVVDAAAQWAAHGFEDGYQVKSWVRIGITNPELARRLPRESGASWNQIALWLSNLPIGGIEELKKAPIEEWVRQAREYADAEYARYHKANNLHQLVDGDDAPEGDWVEVKGDDVYEEAANVTAVARPQNREDTCL